MRSPAHVKQDQHAAYMLHEWGVDVNDPCRADIVAWVAEVKAAWENGWPLSNPYPLIITKFSAHQFLLEARGHGLDVAGPFPFHAPASYRAEVTPWPPISSDSSPSTSTSTQSYIGSCADDADI